MIRLFNRFDFYIFRYKFFLPLIFLFFFLFTSILNNNFYRFRLKSFNLIFMQIIYVVKIKRIHKFLPRVCVSVFLVVFMMNYSSIFPYNFSFTTQIRIVLFFSVCVWFSFSYFSFKNNWKSFLSHKIPEGSPIPLSIFLFLIELVRELIRPLTLTLRLVGNIVVGHVLLILLFNLICHINFIFPIFIVLNIVEVLVSFIQAYIYFTLITMYCREI